MPGDTKPERKVSGGWLIIGAAVLSFCIGVGFFLTIAQTKSGDPIPPDASPSYSLPDAG